jgi:hypothetical protein
VLHRCGIINEKALKEAVKKFIGLGGEGAILSEM